MEIVGERLSNWYEAGSVEIIRRRPRPRWLIEGILPEGGLVFVTGLPASGKSFLVQSWMAAINAGAPWMNRETRLGNVAYFCLEGDSRITLQRVEAFASHYGFEVDFNPWRFNWRESFDYKDIDQVQNLLEAVRNGLSFVVFDTLARVAGSLNLKEQADVSFLGDLTNLIIAANPQATVVVVAHAPKAGDSGISGSVQLNAMGDMIWLMEKGSNFYKASLFKNKNGSERQCLNFALKEVDGSAVLVETSVVPTASQRKANERDATLEAIFKERDFEWFSMPRLVELFASRIDLSLEASRACINKAISRGVLVERRTGKVGEVLFVEVSEATKNETKTNNSEPEVDVVVVPPLGGQNPTTTITHESELF